MFQKIIGKFRSNDNLVIEEKGLSGGAFIIDSGTEFSFANDSSTYLKYYAKVAPVGHAIHTIASAASIVSLLPYSNEKEGAVAVTDDAFVTLFSRPNFQQTGLDYKKEAFIHYLTTGNNYIYLSNVMNSAGTKIISSPSEVFNLRPDYVNAVAGIDGYVDYYQYSSNGTQKTFRKKIITNINGKVMEAFVDNKFGILLHSKEPSTNPFFNALVGDSPLQNVELEIKQYLEASIHNTNLLNNGMSARMMFTPKDGSTPPNAEQVDKIRKYLAENYSGANNAGKNLVIGMPFDAKNLDMNLKDMDFEKLMRRMRVAIYNNFDIPLPMVEGEYTSNSNMKESNLNFYDKAILPLLDKYCDFKYHFIYKNFFPTRNIVKIDYNTTEIPALQERALDNSVLLSKIQSVTKNEIRKYIGMSKTDVGGDAVYIDGNQVAIAGDQNMTDTIGVAANQVNVTE
jgi:phage portal protein BeeE